MRRLVPVMLCLVLLGAAPSWAGLDAKNGELGFDLGYAHLDSNVSDKAGPPFSNLSDKAGVRFNFRGGYCFTKLFELEGQGVGLGTVEAGLPDVYKILGVDFVNAVFNLHPSNKAVVPYVLVGVGHATLMIDLEPGPDVDDSGVAYQVAGGSRFFFGDKKRVAVRVELSVIGEDTFDETSTHVSLTGGFTWRLGGQK